MGYIPAPIRGQLNVGPQLPEAKPNLAHLDTRLGGMKFYDAELEMWRALGTGTESSGSVFYGTIAEDYNVHPDSTVIGEGAYAKGFGTVVGRSAEAANTSTVCVGGGTRAFGVASIAVGISARAGDPENANEETNPTTWDGVACIAIGGESHARGQTAVAIGSAAVADCHDAFHHPVSGEVIETSDVAAVAIGSAARAVGANAIAIGASAVAGPNQAVLATDELHIAPPVFHVGEEFPHRGTPTVPGAPSALVLYDTAGTPWRITVTTAGALSVTPA